MKKKKTYRLLSIITFLLFLLGIGMGIRIVVQKEILTEYLDRAARIFSAGKKPAVPMAVTLLETNIFEKLNQFQVKSSEINSDYRLSQRKKEIKAQIPKGKPFELIIWELSQAAKGTSYSVKDCVFNKTQKTYTLTFVSQNKNFDTIVLILLESSRYQSNSSEIAILITDFHFQADQTTIAYLSFPEPLTFALDPFAKKSTWTAQAAHDYQKEIIIHLPFEPKLKTNKLDYGSTVMIHYPDTKILDILRSAKKAIPYAKGFANFTNSLVIEDSRAMGIVLNAVKQYNAYFVYSQEDNSILVSSLSEKINLSFQKITAAISDTLNTVETQQQLQHYAVTAQKKSRLIIRAKASSNLIKALHNVLPVLHQNGIKLVYVSQIVSEQN